VVSRPLGLSRSRLKAREKMDWFERITGFKEQDYDSTRSRLAIMNGRLMSSHCAATWAVGRLETPTLSDLRARAAGLTSGHGPNRVQCLSADVRELHRHPENAGALFQVASQFNLLEMVGPDVTPEHGITRYETDRTQGPACAIAAGAATIFRNYFAPVGDCVGQRRDAQIDCLKEVGRTLGNKGDRLWRMENGYAICSAEGLAEIDRQLDAMDQFQLDGVRGQLMIGLQWQADITDMGANGHQVSQAFCSALPVAYGRAPRQRWSRFARLVLEGAYEATLLGAILNRQHHGNSTVFLTQLGGGAFGNDTAWIHDAIRRATASLKDAGLNIQLVTYGRISTELGELASALR
jgi:hypothetical protein